MWYVMQVHTGSEEEIREQCEKRISDKVLERCFIPYYEEKRHIQGSWIIREKVLFPGYVFMVTDEVEELSRRLRQVQGFTKLLGTGQEVVPLTREEMEFLLEVGGEKQVVEMSEGIIDHSVTKVYAGPLRGLESRIRKIDRHKRKAWLEVPMFGRMQRIEVGLEIVSKTI